MMLQKLKAVLQHRYTLIFLFCFAVIQGPAFSLMDNYDSMTNNDCRTYIGLARFQFDQNPVRRYRVIIPMLAGGINKVITAAVGNRKPISFPGDFPLSLSFFLVNCTLVSLWGVIIYRFCRVQNIAGVDCMLGLLVMLTCRWTSYIAGLPLVDSLYCIAVALALLGIVERNERLIVASIFLGPFAKEAFIFIVPLIFFFSSINKYRQVVYFLLSGALVFGFHRAYDYLLGYSPASGLEADVYHLQYVRENIMKLTGFHGMYDIFSCFGLWILLPVCAWLFIPAYRLRLRALQLNYIWLLALIILVHMLLSGYFERMILLGMPVICMITALAFGAIREKKIA